MNKGEGTICMSYIPFETLGIKGVSGRAGLATHSLDTRGSDGQAYAWDECFTKNGGLVKEGFLFMNSRSQSPED